MGITFGTNRFSLSVLGGLNGASRSFQQSLERLSSGSRINRASDDAAGISVSSTLNTRSRVLIRARQNIADAVSALSIADSTLESTNALLTRMSELAQSAANGSLSALQRRTLSQEFQALEREIRRITGATQFNGL